MYRASPLVLSLYIPLSSLSLSLALSHSLSLSLSLSLFLSFSLSLSLSLSLHVSDHRPSLHDCGCGNGILLDYKPVFAVLYEEMRLHSLLQGCQMCKTDTICNDVSLKCSSHKAASKGEISKQHKDKVSTLFPPSILSIASSRSFRLRSLCLFRPHLILLQCNTCQSRVRAQEETL
jgi:hypothetical protein